MDDFLDSFGSSEPARVLWTFPDGSPKPTLIKDVGNVRIRPATDEDLPRLASILVEATKDDDVFMHLYPTSRLYPQQYRDGFLRRLKLQHLTPGCVLCVAVMRNLLTWRSKGNEKREAVIVGYCVWQRIGDDCGVDRWKKPKTGFWNGLERTLLNIEERYHHFFNLDKSVNKRHLSDYNAGSMACFPFEESEWSDMWFLEHVAVHPAYRGIGIGQNLVRWGMEHADIEGVPVGVEARGGKKLRLWKSLGFEKLNEMVTPYGGKLCAMFWDAVYIIV